MSMKFFIFLACFFFFGYSLTEKKINNLTITYIIIKTKMVNTSLLQIMSGLFEPCLKRSLTVKRWLCERFLHLNCISILICRDLQTSSFTLIVFPPFIFFSLSQFICLIFKIFKVFLQFIFPSYVYLINICFIWDNL